MIGSGAGTEAKKASGQCSIGWPTRCSASIWWGTALAVVWWPRPRRRLRLIIAKHVAFAGSFFAQQLFQIDEWIFSQRRGQSAHPRSDRCYTLNDRAVGIAYPTASRLSGTVASAFGDANDKFGGLGRNGAQKMELSEVVQEVDHLLAVGGNYSWRSSRFHNLESSKFIMNPNGGDAHMFVTGKEVAWAISRAMA